MVPYLNIEYIQNSHQLHYISNEESVRVKSPDAYGNIYNLASVYITNYHNIPGRSNPELSQRIVVQIELDFTTPTIRY